MEIDANKKGRIAALMEEIHGIHFVNSLYWRLGQAPRKRERNIGAGSIAAYIFNFVTSQRSPVYWAEFFGIYAFAGYWCVKTKEMAGPDIKRLIAEKHEQAVI